jgi:predicted nucleic acid-binding protein
LSDVFLDTVGLLALFNVDDQWHGAADAAYERIKRDGRNFITTSFVFLEAGNAAARTRVRPLIITVRRQMAEQGRIDFPSQRDWEHGWSLYEQNFANRAGIVDCISFAVMRRLGLTEVFSNDQHFTAAGFTTLF